jgi:hypothetical protein
MFLQHVKTNNYLFFSKHIFQQKSLKCSEASKEYYVKSILNLPFVVNEFFINNWLMNVSIYAYFCSIGARSILRLNFTYL